jgi:uncharacterized protein YkwD
VPTRARFLVALLALAAVPAVLVPPSGHASGPPPRAVTAAFDLGILSQLNEVRTSHGLHPLTLSRSLSAAAMAHTRDMVANGYFAHESADGEPFWKRIASFFPDGNYSYWSVGENIFWSIGVATPDAGLRAWMASPDHRATILDPRWTQIGIAALSSASAPGAFDNHDVTVITTDFGVRR